MERFSPNGQSFYGSSGSEPIPQAPALLGVCYDGTTSFRPGTRWGPDAIRAVSDDGMESYSPLQDRDLFEVEFADIGNLEIEIAAPEPVVEAVHDAAAELLELDAIPFILGGEHSISPGAIQAAFEKHPDLAVIQFDAHADLREIWNGSKNSHACAMRRVLDFLRPDRLLQVGIRSGMRPEFVEMREHHRLIPPEPNALASAISDRGFSERPLYVTFDLDVFDPSLLPGTGTPEAGGINWQTFEGLRAAVPAAKIVALDVVEFSPRIDPTDVSSVVAAKLVREWLLAIAPSQT